MNWPFRKAAEPPRPTTKAQRLTREATEAADVRAYQDDPNVAALRIEKIRAKSNTLMWAGLLIGLAFTMTNVQVFAAGGAVKWSLTWDAAWLLDPIPSLILVGILYGESQTSKYQIDSGWWVRAAKWGALAATYAMNTWSAWLAGDPARILQHSIPPAMVFLAAESIPQLRDRLTEAVKRAAIEAARSTRSQLRVDAHAPSIESPGSTHDEPDQSARVDVDPEADHVAQVEAAAARPTPADRAVGSSLAGSGRSNHSRSSGMRRSRPTAGNRTKATAPRSRTDEELKAALAEGIEDKRIDPTSAESIRTELRIAPKRARELRDAHNGSTPDRSLRAVPDRPVPRDPDPDSEESDRAVAVS